MKNLHCDLLIAGVLLLAASGCGESATSPSPPPSPPPPPAVAGPPASPSSPLNYASIVGMYDLSGTITTFDPVWGDLTGWRLTAVLTLAEGVGTYSDLGFVDAEGMTGSTPREGSVAWATSAPPGDLVLDFGRFYTIVIEQIDQPGNGQMAPRFAGSMNLNGHISGPFVATRRTP